MCLCQADGRQCMYHEREAILARRGTPAERPSDRQLLAYIDNHARLVQEARAVEPIRRRFCGPVFDRLPASEQDAVVALAAYMVGGS